MAKNNRLGHGDRKATFLDRFPHIQGIAEEKSLYGLSQLFLANLRALNYSERSMAGREVYLYEFIDWCCARNLPYPVHINRRIVSRYQRALNEKLNAFGKPLSFRGQYHRLSFLRVWFKWMSQENYIDVNPTSDLQLPRQNKALPKMPLSPEDIECILHQCDIHDAVGLRDRAMMEVFYSCGVRRAELAHLHISDLHLDVCALWVREGKGKKDRLLPMGERAVAWVEKYLAESRPLLSCGRDKNELFLTAFGLGFNPDNLTQIVRRYVKKAGLDKAGSCHLFRHAMATHMLENGADIRFIQEMLGHAELATTEIYTRVSVKKLKEIHSLTHPAARLVKKSQSPDVDLITLEELLLSQLDTESKDED